MIFALHFARPALLVLGAFVLVGCSSYRPTDVIRTSADRAFEQSEYDVASAEYGEIIDRYPGDWKAQYRFGKCQLKLDDPAAARRALEIADTAKPGNENVADALAEALFELDEHDQLFAFLNERVEMTRSTRSYLRLAEYAARSGDPDTAKIALDTAIRVNEDRTIEPYVAAARFAKELGDLDLAVRRLSQAYFLDPRDQRVEDMLLELGEVPGPTLAIPETDFDGATE